MTQRAIGSDEPSAESVGLPGQPRFFNALGDNVAILGVEEIERLFERRWLARR